MNAMSTTETQRMDPERMLDKAAKAERRCERYADIEQRCQARGLYEEALEAERMRHEHSATALYWRERARTASPEHAA
jgi:hypothetical protein